jgi:GTP-binding protein
VTFTVVIAGRPNVGKSTLFNRLTGKQHALVDDMPGVTRDRREGDASLGGMEFTIIDTAGLEDAPEGSLAARMTAQTERAIEDADVTLFVVDGRTGITPIDKHFAQLLRRKKTKVILVVNKAEGGKAREASPCGGQVPNGGSGHQLGPLHSE